MDIRDYAHTDYLEKMREAKRTVHAEREPGYTVVVTDPEGVQVAHYVVGEDWASGSLVHGRMADVLGVLQSAVVAVAQS